MDSRRFTFSEGKLQVASERKFKEKKVRNFVETSRFEQIVTAGKALLTVALLGLKTSLYTIFDIFSLVACFTRRTYITCLVSLCEPESKDSAYSKVV